ncbi:hypothetical protein B0H19DRAFT_1375831 [Mycena capillaripes]|nr:hypothetical protein B0H19DRAFT_1375831 [Mycena capillaripes]
MSHRVAHRGAQSARGNEKTRSYTLQRFPEIPAGVAILPFKDFKEHGIQPSLDADGIERDLLGIPTVPLAVKHDTDASKTNPDNNAMSSKPGAFRLGFNFEKEWWQAWEEGEHLQMHGPYDQRLPRPTLLRVAAGHFQKYRRFPVDVYKPLWDLTFKIYAGILGTIPIWQKASEQPNDDQEISDDDFEDAKPKHPREPYELYNVQPPIVETDEEIQVLLAAGRAKRDARAEKFVADPARAIQIYLSSYMYDQGLMWSDRNLVNAPILLRFFVNFLLRNQVFPDRSCEGSLRRALHIIELAGKELPLTSKIFKALPDTLSTACRNCWGSVEGYTTAADAANIFEAALRAENIEIISSENALRVGREADSDSGTSDDGGWSAVAPSAMDWQSVATPTLLELLGPTALPLTHAPGVVERSVRRITSIWAPLPIESSVSLPVHDAANDSASVERELLARMYRVEMAAWPDWDAGGSEYAVPTILRAGSAGRKPHTVANRISLLVEPAAAAHLCVSMALGGIWVQLARLPSTPGATTHPVPPTAEGERTTSEGLWYLDKIMRVLPSYWIAD